MSPYKWQGPWTGPDCRTSGAAVRLWCVAKAVESWLLHFPGLAVSSAGTIARVKGLTTVSYDPLADVDCGGRGQC